MSEYIFVTNIFEYSNIRIYSSHSDPVPLGMRRQWDLLTKSLDEMMRWNYWLVGEELNLNWGIGGIHQIHAPVARGFRNTAPTPSSNFFLFTWCHFCQLQTLKPLLGSVDYNMGDKAQIMTISQSSLKKIISTASGALVVGGVRDICMYVCSIQSGDSFECSME